jgi:hypothetical protein
MWVPHVGSWDEGRIRRKMDAEESSRKGRIQMVRNEYSVLKENMKLDECGWSQANCMYYYY